MVVPSWMVRVLVATLKKCTRTGQSMTNVKALFFAALSAAAMPVESSVPPHFIHSLMDFVASVPTTTTVLELGEPRLAVRERPDNEMLNCLLPVNGSVCGSTIEMVFVSLSPSSHVIVPCAES